MKLVPWATVLAIVVTVGLFVLVALGKLPWSTAAAFLGGSVLPVLNSKGAAQ